ncbi:F-box domain-containing protein [Favolaschia claudopus]|uniref:F-box domain-containing protein n=1 Tax=Favolaschia claudopus TaxID=2862362 RepID=A0AAW0B8V3_9AGAR
MSPASLPPPNIATLRKRIDDLSSTIRAESQEQHIHDLEKEQSEARRQLNSLLDPMARLPLELQSHIFCDVERVKAHNAPHPADVPMLFLSVCHLWSVIALSTPALWTRLEIRSLPCSDTHEELCRKWMGRAGSLPLTLTLGARGSLRLDDSLQELIAEYQHQLETLTLKLGFTRATPRIPRRIEVQGPFPSLRRLTITTGDEIWFSSVQDWLHVLEQCPELTWCRFENIPFDYDEAEELGNSALPLVHTSLHHLDLGLGDPPSNGFDRNSAVVLAYLILPALRTLSISDFDLPLTEFISFFTRSAPPLESLSILVPFLSNVEARQLPQMFAPISGLQHLRLATAHNVAVNRSLEFMDSLAGCLPHLQSLSMYMFSGKRPDYERLLSMLSARRSSQKTPLKAFNLWFSDRAGHDYAADVLSADVLLAFRNLVQDGMEIHVGPLDVQLHRNFLELSSGHDSV